MHLLKLISRWVFILCRYLFILTWVISGARWHFGFWWVWFIWGLLTQCFNLNFSWCSIFIWIFLLRIWLLYLYFYEFRTFFILLVSLTWKEMSGCFIFSSYFLILSSFFCTIQDHRRNLLLDWFIETFLVSFYRYLTDL